MGDQQDLVTREMVIWKWRHQGNPRDSAMEKSDFSETGNHGGGPDWGRVGALSSAWVTLSTSGFELSKRKCPLGAGV